jgi:hypothetical protein
MVASTAADLHTNASQETLHDIHVVILEKNNLNAAISLRHPRQR